MGQTWVDLLFAHWAVPEPALRAVVPPQLPLDTYDGQAWLGITPFTVRGLRLHGTPAVPTLSSFEELNVRTYVSVGGKPGIFFLSLDAASRGAVISARRAFRLPYFHARMSAEVESGEVRYRSERTSRDGPPAAFVGSYRPTGEALPVTPGSIERWLVERYCLYTLDTAGKVLRGEIHHGPWPLHPACARIEHNTMADPFGIELEGEPLLHFGPRQDTVIWRLAPA